MSRVSSVSDGARWSTAALVGLGICGLVAIFWSAWSVEGRGSQRITYDDGKLSEPILSDCYYIEIQIGPFEEGERYLVSATVDGMVQAISTNAGGLDVIQVVGDGGAQRVQLYYLRPGTFRLVLTPLTITERGHVTGEPIVIEQVLE